MKNQYVNHLEQKLKDESDTRRKICDQFDCVEQELKDANEHLSELTHHINIVEQKLKDESNSRKKNWKL